MVEPDVLDRLEHLRVQRVERGQLAAPPARARGELTFSARWSTDDCIGLFSSWLLSARRRHACDTIGTLRVGRSMRPVRAYIRPWSRDRRPARDSVLGGRQALVQRHGEGV